VKRIHAYIACSLVVLGALALAGVVYLGYVFPRTMAAWADHGRVLSGAEQTLANLSDLCNSFGLFVIPALLLVVIGCGFWAVLVGIVNTEESANKRMQEIH
jgi:type II secretory pathway component PulF